MRILTTCNSLLPHRIVKSICYPYGSAGGFAQGVSECEITILRPRDLAVENQHAFWLGIFVEGRGNSKIEPLSSASRHDAVRSVRRETKSDIQKGAASTKAAVSAA